MDERTREQRARSFGAAAQLYDRARPGYPVEAVRAALGRGARRVVDVGAGTGKLTRVLVGLGLDVVAVEPDPAMRALLPASVEALAGTAEELPLADASVDAVVAGQAGLSAPQHSVFEHSQALDADGLVGLAASRSSVLTLPDAERQQVLARVRATAPSDEPFELPYRTVVWRAEKL